MPTRPRVDRLALELTGRCQLACVHCYAESAPGRGHGGMTGADWRRVLDQAVACGVGAVQFIGGEPTLHPEFVELVEHALSAGFRVEVYTNLVRVSRAHWELFRRPRMSVATSYYTADPDRHDRLTGRVGSHARTRANIAEAVRRGVRLRVGVVDVTGEADAACADLRSLGVRDVQVAGVQGIGRAATAVPSADDLCGACVPHRAAVDPYGRVSPCVMARWISVGDVHRDDLAAVLAGPRMNAVSAELGARFAARGGAYTSCDSQADGCDP